MKAGYGNLDASFKSSTPSSNSESENSITISLGNSTRGNSVITVILSLLFLNVYCYKTTAGILLFKQLPHLKD